MLSLVPAQPEESVRAARRNPEPRLLFDQVAQLGVYENFALLGIAGLNAQGRRSDVYVHGKIMLIDDEWATIGSGNLHSNLLLGHTEMNASIWDALSSVRCGARCWPNTSVRIRGISTRLLRFGSIGSLRLRIVAGEMLKTCLAGHCLSTGPRDLRRIAIKPGLPSRRHLHGERGARKALRPTGTASGALFSTRRTASSRDRPHRCRWPRRTPQRQRHCQGNLRWR